MRRYNIRLSFWCLALSPLMHLRTNNFHGATWTIHYRKLEAMQLYNRSDQAQTQAQPFSTAALVRPIEALGHRFTFDRGNARTGVPHTDDGLGFTAKQNNIYT